MEGSRDDSSVAKKHTATAVSASVWNAEMPHYTMPGLMHSPLPTSSFGTCHQSPKQPPISKYYKKVHKHKQWKPYQSKPKTCQTKKDNSVRCNETISEDGESRDVASRAVGVETCKNNETGKLGDNFINKWYLVDSEATLDTYIHTDNPCHKVPTILSYQEEFLNNETLKAILRAERKQCEEMKSVLFTDPVTCVYCPLVYAFEPHLDFLQKYCTTEKPILFLGMNPGPFGMVQTGVPFGEVRTVEDWLGIVGRIRRPKYEHPKRPVQGYACPRSEISGKRFWGLFQRLCGKPETFFRHCFVHNLCPLAFMSSSGKNITQPELPLETRREMNRICDETFIEIVNILKVRVVICLGRFVESRVKSVQKANPSLGSVQVESLSHPSPLNRSAHRLGWETLAEQQLHNMDVMKYITS